MPTSLQTVKGVTLFQPPGVGGNVPPVAAGWVDVSNQLTVALTLRWPSVALSHKAISLIQTHFKMYVFKTYKTS